MQTKKLKRAPFVAMGLLCWIIVSQSDAEETNGGLCSASKVSSVMTLTESAIAHRLGWVPSNDNRCGGYYLEAPLIEPGIALNRGTIKISGNQGEFSLHGTSTYEGNVTITQDDQQMIANKAYLYRDPETEKFNSIDLIGSVTLREPNDLIVAECGHLDLKTNHKRLQDILYRTAIYSRASVKPPKPTSSALQQEQKVTQLSAWGRAQIFTQTEPRVYELQQTSYTTCSPLNPTWQVEADHVTLDKNTGRGIAKQARLTIKGVPVFYAPYLNFPIDSRRQSGFLWPTVGTSSEAGVTVTTPFYWNIAPNYDDTIAPSVLGKRGLQISNLFRYLNASPDSHGEMEISLLPNDKLFSTFQQTQENENQFSASPVIQSELHRLQNASTTRGAVSWQNKTRFNDHWTTNLDYNYVSDDYYLKDFSNGVNEITPNQLLQEGDINYKGQHWLFSGRIQGYQTLHPIDESTFFNQYVRLPQITLDGNFHENRHVNYFIQNELTYFDIAKNPGNLNPGNVETLPIGYRANSQPGISFPYYSPAFYVRPRLQFAVTQYDLQHIEEAMPSAPRRALPIFDVNSGLYFDRDMSLFKYSLRQTLEPRIYYTYVPYRNQDDIPIFDTTVNTLTYDQLFTYNRFSGLDRIGDANQISVGITTRFIDQQSGFEKISAGVGQILYFSNRRVTLCNSATVCADYPGAPENTNSRSPLSAVVTYYLTPQWSATSNTIWDSQEKELDNETFTLRYVRDIQSTINLSYTYVRNGDAQLDVPVGSSANNLSQTDLSFTWPITREWSSVARWTENWNRSRFQNLLYGLQYDTCCWALRVVTGRTFTSLTPNNTYQYNTEFYIQFALKGLGNIGTGNPGHILNSPFIANQTNFGQDY